IPSCDLQEFNLLTIASSPRPLQSVCSNCAVPEGTRFLFPLYPGLTPWANIISPLRGLILRQPLHRANSKRILTYPPQSEWRDLLFFTTLSALAPPFSCATSCAVRWRNSPGSTSNTNGP